MLFDFLVEMLREVLYADSLHKLEDLIVLLKISFEDIILEEAKLLKTIWENHKADTILHTLKPIPAINVSIDPVHFSIPLSHVIFVFSFEDITALPIEFTIAVFLISPVLALKLVANSLDWR